MHVVVWARIEDIEKAFAGVTNFQHASHVPAAVAVVWCTPYSAEPVVKQDLEAFLAELVRTQDVRHGVDFEELLDHLRPKRVSGSSWAKRELVALGVGVAPDKIGHGPLVGYFTEAVDDFDLINGVDRGGQATVDTEDLVVDDDGEGEEVEHVGEVVPHVGVTVLAGAFRIEAVRLGYAAGLVVPADEVDAVRVAQLQADEQRYGLDREEAAVDIVACRGRGSDM